MLQDNIIRYWDLGSHHHLKRGRPSFIWHITPPCPGVKESLIHIQHSNRPCVGRGRQIGTWYIVYPEAMADVANMYLGGSRLPLLIQLPTISVYRGGDTTAPPWSTRLWGTACGDALYPVHALLYQLWCVGGCG